MGGSQIKTTKQITVQCLDLFEPQGIALSRRPKQRPVGCLIVRVFVAARWFMLSVFVASFKPASTIAQRYG